MATVNRIANAEFSSGASRPSGWEWQVDSGRPSWRFVEGRRAGARHVMLESPDGESAGAMVRNVRIKGSTYYRVEATVDVDCRRTQPTGGFSIDVAAQRNNEMIEESSGHACASADRSWTIWRRYYQTPQHATQLIVRLALRDAVGSATVASVRVIPIEEPEACSHVLAVPPPPFAYPAPRRVSSVVIVGESESAERLRAILALRLGETHVRLQSPRESLDAKRPPADAIIFPSGDRLPPRFTLTQLHRLADHAVVIIGLDAFADAAAGRTTTPVRARLAVQEVEPFHARVAFASFLTRGFALNDAFGYWWDDESAGVYKQRYLRNTPALRKFCRQENYETALANEGETDATSRHPLCLYHPGANGGVIVLDTEPIVTHPTSEDESTLPAHILFNALGVPQVTVGQFAVPPTSAQRLVDDLDEMGRRFAAVQIHRLGQRATAGRWVEVGGVPETFGLPMALPPVVLLRTGFQPWAWDGVYGTMLWIKNLFRPPPYASPYVRDLLAARRIAWMPIADPHAWSSGRADAGESFVAEFEPGSLAAVIDIHNPADGEARVVVPEASAAYRRYDAPLRSLAASTLGNRHLYYAAGGATRRAELNGTGFLPDDSLRAMTVDEDLFATDFHRAARQSGAQCLRLDLPHDPYVGAAHSIRLTDRVAVCVELLVGLHVGIVAVNRDAEALGLRVPMDLPDGAQIHLRNGESDPDSTRMCSLGRRGLLETTLEPGHALVLAQRMDRR